MAEEPGAVHYDWQSAGTFFGVFATPQFVQALFTVYLLHELKVPGSFKGKTQAKNKRQFSNPWRPKCSEGSCSGHEKRSGRCLALNATVSMFDNFVWLPRTCVPGGVRSKKAIRTSLFLSDARVSAPAPTVFTAPNKKTTLHPRSLSDRYSIQHLCAGI